MSSCDVVLSRNAQIGVKQESVEGTAETLAAADAKMLVYSPSFTTNIARYQRKPARGTLSNLPAIPGKQAASLKWSTEFKGSGAVGTAPSWATALLACGAQQNVVKTIAVGSITGGPYQAGETITGTTSAATGRVVGDCSATPLHYVALSGTFQNTETITGSTSGATSTSGGTPQDNKGFEYTPDSTCPPSVTAGLFQDGLLKQIHGARGTWSLSASVDGILMVEFDFQGVYSGVSDTALLSGISYESVTPPAFLGLSFNLASFTTATFTAFKLACGNTIAERPDVTDAKGIKSFFVTDRAPTGNVDPELCLVATHDFYGRFVAGTTGRLYTQVGSSAGQVITIAAPRIQYSNVTEGDRNSIVLANLDFELKSRTDSSADDEWQIAMI